MASEDFAAGDQSSPAEDLAAVHIARQSAVDSTRRPKWLNVAYAAVLGATLGSGLLSTSTGWVMAGGFFLMSVVLVVLAHRQTRRSGRLLGTGKGPALGFIILIALMMLIGQIEPPAGSQPWLAVVGGALVAILGYGYLRLEDVDTAKRLQSGDFSPDDLMP